MAAKIPEAFKDIVTEGGVRASGDPDGRRPAAGYAGLVRSRWR